MRAPASAFADHHVCRSCPAHRVHSVQMVICTDALDALYLELKRQGVAMSALIAQAFGVTHVGHPLLFTVCTPDSAGMTHNEHVNVAHAVAMPDGGVITSVRRRCLLSFLAAR